MTGGAVPRPLSAFLFLRRRRRASPFSLPRRSPRSNARGRYRRTRVTCGCGAPCTVATGTRARQQRMSLSHDLGTTPAQGIFAPRRALIHRLQALGPHAARASFWSLRRCSLQPGAACWGVTGGTGSPLQRMGMVGDGNLWSPRGRFPQRSAEAVAGHGVPRVGAVVTSGGRRVRSPRPRL
jgi:hypothetical protein